MMFYDPFFARRAFMFKIFAQSIKRLGIIIWLDYVNFFNIILFYSDDIISCYSDNIILFYSNDIIPILKLRHY